MSDKPKFSLQQEIHKRKTQELARAAEAKRKTGSLARAEVHPPQTPPPGADSKRSSQVTSPVSPDPRRTSQTLATAKRTTQTLAVAATRLSAKQKRTLIAAAALIMSIIVCFGTLAIASNELGSGTPTPGPLPMVSANDVLAYLNKAGVKVSSVQPFGSVGTPWRAAEAVQFNAQVGSDKGVFILLSYTSTDRKVPDIFSTANDAKYKTWHLTTASNVILLEAPDTSTELGNAMESHLTQYLVAPYRSFLPTATVPSAATSPAS